MEEGTTRQILSEARQKLQNRQGRVQAVADRSKAELDEANRAIKLLDRALGDRPADTPAAPTRPLDRPRPLATGAESPRGRFTQKVIELLRDTDGRSTRSIADQFGSTTEYVASICGKAAQDGKLRGNDGCWQVVE